MPADRTKGEDGLMSTRLTPPFRADHVGSLVRPQALIDARTARENGEIPADELLRIQQAAIREVVKRQEDIGLKSVTDGEFNRGTWQTDFLLKFENVKLGDALFTIHFHNEQGSIGGKPHAVNVVGKLRRSQPMFVEDFKFLKSVTHQTPKITIPSPSVMHFRGGRHTVSKEAYPDMAEFLDDLAKAYSEEVSDLAAAGCRYLQLDEVNFAYLCDTTLREQVRTNIGEDPDTLPATYATLINKSIAGRPKDMAVCLHICRGNFKGRWMAEGGYDPVAETLFNEIQADGYFLEYDSLRAGGFEPLRFLPKGKVAVLGLLTTKKGELESKDELKRRIEEASRFAPIEQLALSPQCGFASGIAGATMSADEQFAKLRLVVEVAEEVWGYA